MNHHSILLFGIPYTVVHLFQIYASVLCDMLWISRNKAIPERIIPDISKLAVSIKKSFLAHAECIMELYFCQKRSSLDPSSGRPL
jgi:hypothetical protein